MTPTPTACQIDDGGRCRRIIINAYILHPTAAAVAAASFLSICAAMLHIPTHARTSGIVVCIDMYQYGRIPVRPCSVRWRHCVHQPRHPPIVGGKPTGFWYACSVNTDTNTGYCSLCVCVCARLCGICDLYMCVCVV